MDAFAAGQQRKALEPDELEASPHLKRRVPHGRKAELFVRIEVDHQTIRLVDVLDTAAPAVELDRVGRHQLGDALLVGDVKVLLRAAVLLLDGEAPYPFTEGAGVRRRVVLVALEPALAAETANH